MDIECTQRLESTQEQHDTRYMETNLEQVGYLGICGKKYMVSKGPNKIGRDPQSCSIVLNLNSISRHHAVINVLNMKEFMLMDLDSVNKTKVQGKTLQPYIPHPLKNCDMVQFGDVFGVFRLLEDVDDLPMTQALDIPCTPVPVSKQMSRCGAPSVLIPESPEVSDKDDSFIMPSQPIQTSNFKSPLNKFLKQSKKTIAIQPMGSKTIDNAFWQSGKKSDSFHLDDSGSSLNDSTMSHQSNKVIDESIENIHEMETQEPFKINDSTDSIYTADTQQPLPSPSIHFMDTQQPVPDIHGLETQQAEDIHSLETQNVMETVHHCATQAPIDDIKQEDNNVKSELLNDNKENVKYDNIDNSVYNAETQVFAIEKEENPDLAEPEKEDALIDSEKTAENNESVLETANEKNESDEEILFDDINSQSIEEAFESQQLLPTELSPQIDRIENIQVTSKSIMLTNPKECENFDILPTQKIILDADTLPNQKILDDIDILPTQKINYDDEDLTDCEDDIVNDDGNKPKGPEVNFEDMATQILGDDEIEAELPKTKDQTDGNSKRISFEDMPTQIITDDSKDTNFEDMLTQIITEEGDGPDNLAENAPATEVYSEEIISPFKVPFSTPVKSKRNSSLAKTNVTPPKSAVAKKVDVEDPKYYAATQDIFNDLCSQKQPSVNDDKQESTKQNASDNDDDLVPCSVEEFEMADTFKNIENDQSPVKISANNDGSKTTEQKTKRKVVSDNSHVDANIKTPKTLKIINAELPDSQEIKTSVTLNHKSITESSSDSEVEEISDQESDITFGKKKKKPKINAKLNLAKKFEESLPTRVITRIRKPTFKIQNSDESTKNQCRSILKNSLLGDSEDSIDSEIINENISRLKNKHDKKRGKEDNTSKRQSNEPKKRPESRNESKKTEKSKDHSSNHSKSSRSKSKKSKETKLNNQSDNDSAGEKKVRSTRSSRHKEKKDERRDKTRTDSKDNDRSDSKSRSRTRNVEVKTGDDAKSKENKRNVRTDSSPEQEIRRSKRNKTSDKDKSKHENSTVYCVSSESSIESPRALKRPARGELEVPSPKRTRSLPNSKSSSVCTSSNVSPCSTPVRSQVHYVLFTAFSNDDVRKKLENLGAVLVTDVMACTVLVTLQIKRTFKLLCAVGLGRPIVGPDWVQACADTNSIVDPWQYIVKDAPAEKRFRFSLDKTLRGKRNFLKGYSVCSTPSVLPNAQEMKLIVECSGGSWEGETGVLVAVTCHADRALWPALRRRGAALVSTEFILGGVLRQRADTLTSALGPVTRGVKRKRDSTPAVTIVQPQEPSTSRTAAEPPSTPVVGDTVECKTCRRNVSRRAPAVKKQAATAEFVCEECGRRCLSRIGLSSHSRAHTRS